MRVGVFGGSFDPVHLGHLELARLASRELSLDEVIFIPARVQPLKSAGAHASPADRLAMLRLAVQDREGFVVDDRELRRDGPSYTIDTLRELRSERPRDELFLLVGSDAAGELPRWREGSAISALATIAVVPRAGAPVPAGAMAVNVHPPDVSATEIRSAVARGLRLDGLVPPAVARYIENQGLYQTGV